MAKRFDVEVVNSEAGEETTQNYLVESQVRDLFRKMKVGDALVINRTEDSSSGLSGGGQL